MGIESTVVDLTGQPKILRPGIISSEILEKFLKIKIDNAKKNSKIKSPGMFKKHYSPGIPLILNQTKYNKKHALISFSKIFKNKKIALISVKNLI